ncbi:MAG: TolC family protein [Rubrivivax sp.]|nr:TolC family protein [Rubrivivax sp.]
MPVPLVRPCAVPLRAPLRRALSAVGAAALAWAALPAAGQPTTGLDFARAQQLALLRAPMLAARRAAVDAASQLRISAGELPDPKVSAGVDGLPISGPMRWQIAAEPMTQRSFAWMQDVPNAAKRAARRQGAEARTEREQALLTMEQLSVQRETAGAWLARWYAEQRLALFTGLEEENRLLRQTLDARVAAGSAMPADATMARQEALMLADRRDELVREQAQAQAALRRWLGDDASLPLAGPPPALAAERAALFAGIDRHADLRAFEPMQRMTQAEVAEAESMKRGDWAWQVMYSRRGSSFGDMVSFQFTFELPLWSAQRQDPQIAAKRNEAERIEAEREDMVRRRREELDMQLAELDELMRKAARLREAAVPLATERVALALAAYEGNRGDLAGVLAARRERAELGLRALELDARQQALRARLNYLIAEQR